MRTTLRRKLPIEIIEKSRRRANRATGRHGVGDDSADAMRDSTRARTFAKKSGGTELRSFTILDANSWSCSAGESRSTSSAVQTLGVMRLTLSTCGWAERNPPYGPLTTAMVALPV